LFASLVTAVETLAFTSFGGRPAIVVFIFLGLSSALLVGVRSLRIGSRRTDRATQVFCKTAGPNSSAPEIGGPATS
jgi:hypothetical protein